MTKNKEYLIEKIKNKTLDPTKLARMHREELYPEKWDNLFKLREEDSKKKRVKGAHRCPRCKSWYTEHIEV
jgi:hypothetical protein